MPAGTVPGRRWIRGAEVLRSASHAAPERADIWIEDGRIVALTDTEAAPLFGSEAQTIDGSGLLAIPGLVNGHTHSQSALLQGAVPGEPLDLFVIRAMARRAPRSSRAAYVGASLHAMAMLKRGITAHVDHLRDGLLPSAENVEAALEAYRDIGIRAVVAPMYEDRMYLDSLPIDQHALPQEVRSRWRSTRRPPPEHYFALMEHLIKRWHGEKRTIMVVVHDHNLVREHFPETLLLARRPIAWGDTLEALRPENLLRARSFDEAWRDDAPWCEPDHDDHGHAHDGHDHPHGHHDHHSGSHAA